MVRRRVLSLSVVRVEVRLYRRSRTACDVVQKPPHLEYFLRCCWTGDSQFAEAPDAPECWWDELPPSYEIRRRWSDILRFHETLVRDLVWDHESGCRRVKARVPELPSKGNIDEFMHNVAATGDACALSKGRRGFARSSSVLASHEDLSDLHTIYVENRLAPYFAEVSAILKEVPTDVLHASKSFWQFATKGPSSLQRQQTLAYEGMLAQAELEAAALESRESPSWQINRRSPPARSAANVERGLEAQTSAAAPASEERDALSALVETPKRAMSHYDFFAKHATPHAFGSRSGYDLERQMAVKGRRELGRRAMVDSEQVYHDRCTQHMTAQRSMARRNPHSRSSPMLLSSGKAAVSDGSANLPTPHRHVRADAMMIDICLGLRTIILGEEPPEQNDGRRSIKPAEISTGSWIEGSQEAVLMVYGAYRRLLERESRSPSPPQLDGVEGANDSSEDEAASPEQRRRRHERKRLAYIHDHGVCRELMPVGWPTFFWWIERKSDLADCCRVKSACAALSRALRDWRQREASEAQSFLGVCVDMLLQWVWPCAAYNNIARMLTWIGRHEFEKLRQATPKVISKEDRLQLENIFGSMLGGKCQGYITAEDLAGGANHTEKAKLKNIVDADTVKAVCGQGPINLLQFLELMCEDNSRAHEDARHATLEDGRRLELSVREVLGCRGWVCRDVPAEESQWRLVDTIEAEVRSWMRRANVHHGTSFARASADANSVKQRKQSFARMLVQGVT